MKVYGSSYDQARGESDQKYVERMRRVVDRFDTAFARQGRASDGQVRNQARCAARRDAALARIAQAETA